MNEKINELIAIGAAYAANCEACLAYHIREAPKYDISVDEIRMAVEIGGIVKNAYLNRTDNLLERLLNTYDKSKAA